MVPFALQSFAAVRRCTGMAPMPQRVVPNEVEEPVRSAGQVMDVG